MGGGAYRFRIEPADIFQGLAVLFRILNQYVHNNLMLAVLSSQVRRLVIIPALPAHRNRRIEIKLEISWRLDEFLQLINILQLGVAVQ